MSLIKVAYLSGGLNPSAVKRVQKYGLIRPLRPPLFTIRTYCCQGQL